MRRIKSWLGYTGHYAHLRKHTTIVGTVCVLLAIAGAIALLLSRLYPYLEGFAMLGIVFVCFGAFYMWGIDYADKTIYKLEHPKEKGEK